MRRELRRQRTEEDLSVALKETIGQSLGSRPGDFHPSHQAFVRPSSIRPTVHPPDRQASVWQLSEQENNSNMSDLSDDRLTYKRISVTKEFYGDWIHRRTDACRVVDRSDRESCAERVTTSPNSTSGTCALQRIDLYPLSLGGRSSVPRE